MKHILVTGGRGFAGKHLVPQLQAAWPEAEILATGQRDFDVADRVAVAAAVSRFQPDACVHLAGIAAIGAAGADPARAWAVNLFGAINMAEAILAHAPGCRLVFVSSSEVYGGNFNQPAPPDETATLAPLNLYAATKAAAEMALMALTASGLKLLRLRPFNHTGAGQSEAFVVPAFAAQIARIEAGLLPPELLVGALEPAREFLDVRDICAGYVLGLQKFDTLPANSVLNLANGRPMQIAAMLNELLAMTDRRITIRPDPARLRKTDIPVASGNAALAETLLGWRPRHGSHEAFAAVLAAARAL